MLPFSTISRARLSSTTQFFAILLSSMLLSHSSLAGDFHVAVDGSATGSGSLSSPWSLTHALSHPVQVAPGDTIWVHEGVYPGHFVSKLLGTAARPIVVRNYRGGRATLEDQTGGDLILAVGGGYTWFWGLEVRSVSTNLTNSSGVVLGGPGIKCINMVVHDCLGSGINPFKEAIDAEVYGSFLYYNGRQTEKAGGAYGSYMQNVSGNKLIRDNVYHHNWSYGIHAYESGGADLDNMTFEGNAIFNNGLFYEPGKFRTNVFLGGDDVHTADNNVFRNNYTYYSPAPTSNQCNAIGHTAGATNTLLEGNFWVSPGDYAMVLKSVGNTINNNVFLGKLIGLSSPGYPANTYYTSWPSRPDDIFVRPNTYEPGRGHIIAYNWDGSATIEVDISSLLAPGTDFYVKDALSFYGPDVVSGTYNGGKITIPMTGRVPDRPQGNPVTQPIHTAPYYGVFVVLSSPSLMPKPTGSITVTPDTLSSGGGSATLSWSANNSTLVSIDQGIGTVLPTGTREVISTTTTRFTLTMTGPGGTTLAFADLVVRAPTAAPQPLSPVNHATNVPTAVTLQWSSVSGASSYDIILGRDSSLNTVVMRDSALGSQSRSVESLEEGRQYFWKVRATAGGQWGPYSPTWDFTTEVSPGKTTFPLSLMGQAPEALTADVAVAKPQRAASAIVVLQVYDADAAAEGKVYINSRDSLVLFGAQSANTNDQHTVTVKYRTSASCWDDGPNTIRFLHSSTAGFVVEAMNVSFTVKPGKTHITAPTNGTSGNPNVVLLQWERTEGSDSYRIQLSADSLFTVVDLESTTSDTSSTLTGLNAAQVYFARVRGENAEELGDYSDLVSFQTSGTGTSVDHDRVLPTEFSLEQNYPNPFNPATAIGFSLPHAAYTSLEVFSALGERVAMLWDGDLEAGRHEVRWDATGQASGVYFYRLTSGQSVAIKRTVLLR